MNISREEMVDLAVSFETACLALTPGSPAYVRRLRDQAAVAALGGMLANPDLDRFGFGRDGKTPGDVAVEEANRTVSALGYPVPEDQP